MSEALITWSGPIESEWTDFNGHLRDAFYMLLFSYGCDGTLERLGLDAAGRAATGHSTFTLECHVNYLLEVGAGTQVEVRTQLLAHDAKRMHAFLTLHRAGTEPVLACSEQMWLNVDMATRRAAPYAPSVLARVQALAAQHRHLPRPAQVGRVIGLPVPAAGR